MNQTFRAIDMTKLEDLKAQERKIKGEIEKELGRLLDEGKARCARMNSRPININECPSCSRMFVDGETCSRGGCPMGGDF